jgi:antitoxin ParD1/3/4
MKTVTLAIPDGLKEFVEARASERGYRGVSEYVSDLIRADQQQAAWVGLEAKVVEGLDSGESAPMTNEDWAALRARVGRSFNEAT